MRSLRLGSKICLFSCLCFLLGCEADYSDKLNRSYDDYSVYQLDNTNFMNQFYSMEDESYAIYLYDTSCPYCDSIKGAVFDYLDNNDSNEMKLYIFNRSNNDSYRTYFKSTPSEYDRDELIEEMIGSTSLDETYFFAVPSLYIIENGTLIDYYVGSSQIGAYLTSL